MTNLTWLSHDEYEALVTRLQQRRDTITALQRKLKDAATLQEKIAIKRELAAAKASDIASK